MNETTGNVVKKNGFRTPNPYTEIGKNIGTNHSEVTIGYDAPWRKVHQLLIDAALATPGIQADPESFVLETSLSDWYPVYQVNAYIKDADKMAAIYSVLHQNIQDYFNKAGIEIMSPHYIATRDGNEITIPKETAKE